MTSNGLSLAIISAIRLIKNKKIKIHKDHTPLLLDLKYFILRFVIGLIYYSLISKSILGSIIVYIKSLIIPTIKPNNVNINNVPNITG